jgi:hypothetical protein
VHPGRQRRRNAEEAHRLAALRRLHDLGGCALRIHRDQRQAGAEGEPAVLGLVLALRLGVQVRAGPHQARHDGRHADAVFRYFCG